MKKNIPNVMLVGRTNVGKSTLFNRLSESVKSLTFNQPGVTRDFISDTITWNNTTFNLIDTGGLVSKPDVSNDPLLGKVQEVVQGLLQQADVIVFVCDGTVGVLPEDRAINKLLFTLKKPILLVVNKIDTHQAQETLHEFYQLGHGTPLAISAQHGTSSGDLLDAIVEHVKKATPNQKEEPEPRYSVVLLGKPNVGKSSLMNLLLSRERSIVSDIAGTTREAIKEPVRFYKETLELVDTPGIRRKRGVTEKLEQMMVHSAFNAIKNSDIVLLLIDGSDGHLSDQELKLAFYAFREHKALILLINKSDLVTTYAEENLTREIDFYDALTRKIPQLHISCLTGLNIGKILPLIDTVWQRHSQQLDNLALSEFLKDALQCKPLYHNGKMLILYKAEQVKTAPITIVLLVNEPKWFGESQLAFFENTMRKKYDLDGAPVRFLVRKRG